MKNRLFLLIICALLSYTPMHSSDTKAQQEALQENLVSLTTNGQPYDDATLTEVANQIKQISVGFELNNNNNIHSEELWKELIGSVINFYSKVINAESKETIFNNMIECLNDLGSKDSHGRINVLLGTSETSEQQDELESLEAQS